MPAAARLKTFALSHVWLLPLLMLALWLRLIGLRTEHLYGDEAEYAIVARYLSRDFFYLAYPDIAGLGAVPFVSQPPLGLYGMALSMKIFGATDFAAILPSVLYGTATVAAVYALGYRLGGSAAQRGADARARASGRFVGLGAAAIVAPLPFHIEMSRRGMLDAGYVFWLVMAAYFCVAWLQDRRLRQAIGVGAAVACAALSKLPGALAGPAVLIVFALALVMALRQDKTQTVAVAKHGAIGAAIVAGGALLYLALLAKLEAVADLRNKLTWQFGRIDTDRAIAREMAAIERAPSWYFTDPKFSFQNELTPIVFALALVGLLAIVVRLAWRERSKIELAVIPIFVGVLLAFFLYSDRKEGFYLLPFAPFAAILVAQAADSLRALLAWAGLRFAPSSASRGVAIGAMAISVVLVAAPAYASASESVDDFVHGADQEKYFGYGTREAAAFIHARDPDAAQYGTLLGRFSLHWYNEHETYHWYVDHTLLENRIKSGELRYLVYENYLDLAFDRDYMLELIERYHGQEVETFRSGWGEVIVYEVHA